MKHIIYSKLWKYKTDVKLNVIINELNWVLFIQNIYNYIIQIKFAINLFAFYFQFVYYILIEDMIF